MNATLAASAAVPELPADVLRPRSAERAAVGVVFAAIAHLLLIAALSLGVNWRMTEPEGGEVDLWDGIPQAAPAPLPPEARVEPPPQKPQPPQPAPTPPEPVPPPEHELAELADAASLPKPPPKPKAVPKPAPQVKAQVVAKPATKPVSRPAPAPATAAAPSLKSQREAAMNRMLSELGAEGGTGSARTSKPAGGRISAAYAGRVRARIKPNIVFTDAAGGNVMAIVRVRCDATGRIVSQQLVESSGLPAWDEAVQRAITRTEVLPLDEDGRCPTMELAFRPQDF